MKLLWILLLFNCLSYCWADIRSFAINHINDLGQSAMSPTEKKLFKQIVEEHTLFIQSKSDKAVKKITEMQKQKKLSSEFLLGLQKHAAIIRCYNGEYIKAIEELVLYKLKHIDSPAIQRGCELFLEKLVNAKLPTGGFTIANDKISVHLLNYKPGLYTYNRLHIVGPAGNEYGIQLLDKDLKLSDDGYYIYEISGLNRNYHYTVNYSGYAAPPKSLKKSKSGKITGLILSENMKSFSARVYVFKTDNGIAEIDFKKSILDNIDTRKKPTDFK